MAKGTGDFFAIDRRAFDFVCNAGLNPAVAYLVLARGSGRDNRTSAWSVNAVETYTGIGRRRAGIAIQTLLGCGAIRKPKPDALRYFIAPAHELHGCEKLDASPDWIWLPNSLVDGAAGEIPPVELVRQIQDVAVLRMFINMYHGHNLVADGGVGWRSIIRREYDRKKVGEAGSFVVWGFSQRNDSMFLSAPIIKPFLTGKYEDCEGRRRDTGVDPFWKAWGKLRDTGLVEMVPHLVEADTDDAEIIHPYAGGEIESQLGAAAHAAGEQLLTDGQRTWAAEQGLKLVPVLRHRASVQMIGIARLRYRPPTSITAAWHARQSEWLELKQNYLQIVEDRGSKTIAFSIGSG